MFFKKKKYLNREELISLLEFNESGRRKNSPNAILFVQEELNIIGNYMKRKPDIKYNDNFILSSRSKWCYEEFNRNIEEKKLEQCFYNLYEYIESDKKEKYKDFEQINSGYVYDELISSKEMYSIIQMYNSLKDLVEELKVENNM